MPIRTICHTKKNTTDLLPYQLWAFPYIIKLITSLCKSEELC